MPDEFGCLESVGVEVEVEVVELGPLLPPLLQQ